ncbi:MAG: DNA polymerase III subunit delta [Planctomycetaceae bacterium]|nr:DNA polymerase III subunit delta [Planctomycetaceae bacterium]
MPRDSTHPVGSDKLYGVFRILVNRSPVHATAFLADPDQWQPAPIVVLHGDEPQLKSDALRLILSRTLGEDDGDFDCTRYAGGDVELKTVRDELLTVSMFSSARAVVVEDADDFVSRHRDGLEDYFARPSKTALLVLAVKSWPKTTRLAKKLPDVGIDVQCSELTGAPLLRWIGDQTQSRYGKRISRDAVTLLVELAGTGLGLLSSELDKLAAYVGERDQIGVEDVRTLVGGWRAETTWEMINAVRDGRADAAVSALDKLLTAGEPPQKLLGGVNFVFRKFAEATERARGGTPLRAALQQAGVFPRDIDSAERYLRRVGRPRAEEILPLLATADANLKGRSRVSERLQMEQLLLALCGALPTA